MYHVPSVPRVTSVTAGTSAPSGTWYTNVNLKTKGKMKMIIKHEANDKMTTEFMEAFMKKNQKNYQKNYQKMNEKNNDPLMETINRLFPVGKEMTPKDIDIIMDMIVNMSPIKRTPEELAAIRKEIEFGLILANTDVDENAVIKIHKEGENLSDFEKAKLEFLKAIYPEKVIAPEDMDDFTKLWYGDFVPKKFIRAVKNSRKS